MKVTSYRCIKRSLSLVEGYRIAGHSINAVTNFIVRIETDNGLVGHGCAAPAEEVTGESDALCYEVLNGVLRQHIEKAALQDDPTDLALKLLALAPGAPAACAAVDIALWDVVARAAGKPLAGLFGSLRPPMATSVTIGICDVKQTLAEADDWLEKGYRILKIKTGENVADDIERLRQLRTHCGKDITLRVDANRGYTLAEARSFLRQTSDLDIQFLEQPLAADDLAGSATLTAESNVPILADESVVSIADAERVIRESAATGVNIKLMKCGGLSAARLIHDHAHAAGLSVMLGCNDETRISIAAALHFSLAMPGVRYIDLDGHMDLADDPAAGGFNIENGVMHLQNTPGLGVNVQL